MREHQDRPGRDAATRLCRARYLPAETQEHGLAFTDSRPAVQVATALPDARRGAGPSSVVGARLDGTDLFDAAVQPMQEQLSGSRGMSEGAQVLDGVAQLVVGVELLPAVAAGPPPVGQLDHAEMPRHSRQRGRR
jgi:hypothetical protein